MTSGVLISNKGYILTSQHGIREYSQMNMSLCDNEGKIKHGPFPVRIIAKHPVVDLAILKADFSDFEERIYNYVQQLPYKAPFLTPGASVSMKGYPLNAEWQFKLDGRLLERNVDPSMNYSVLYIQPYPRYAELPQGFSGGPVILENTNELIGINLSQRSLSKQIIALELAPLLSWVNNVINKQ